MTHIPQTDIDLWSDEVLLDPYPSFREIRNLGPVVYMTSMSMHAVSRYDDVRAGLRDWRRLTSAEGQAFNSLINEKTKENVLCVDPPRHDELRDVLWRGLSPGALHSYESYINELARRYVSEITVAGRFDAAELARRFPIEVVAHVVGLPDHVRDQLADWGISAFNSTGPWNPRAESSLISISEADSVISALTAQDMREGSIGRAIAEAAEKGEMSESERMEFLSDLTLPATDTTISAVGCVVSQLALNSDNWASFCRQPGNALSVVNEGLRFEAPLQAVTRVAREPFSVGGKHIEGGERVALLIGSANRDERHYPEPDVFDPFRDPRDHLSFGLGPHTCVGAALARLELQALCSAMAETLKTLDAGEPEYFVTNSGRRLARLEVAVS
jgi:cytochrome P450